jgi:pyridoxine 5-phosphate synthase
MLLGMTKLSVNVNKVALLRNSRTIGIPSVVKAAEIAIEAGAQGITVHPRPDERHVRASDVPELARLARQHGVELNVEGNPFEARWLEIVRGAKPAQATLVPDSPEQATSDHGWDLRHDGERLRPIITELKRIGCRVSLFMDAVAADVPRAKDVGADRIELYTEPYAAAFAAGRHAEVLPLFASAAHAAARTGLGVNAGHDLNRANLGPFLRALPNVLEVSIGHALIADALELGLAETVRDYLRVIAATGAGR